MYHNNAPLISAITVCYNAEEIIEKTLKSITTQNCNDIEYIVIDGKSTDKTCDIIERYKNQISQFISEKDTGIYNTMNKGVKVAQGEWIIFINAGDTFAEICTLNKVIPYLSTPDYDIVYGDVLRKDRKRNLISKKASAPINMHRMFFCHQSSFCRKKLLIENPFDEKYKLSSDFKFIKISFLRGCRFKQVDFPIAIFDLTGVSNTRRNVGLWENVFIVREIDHFKDKIRLLPKLYYVIFWNFIRGKS
jgi:glycosyltransferase involved in cell wall biosynthesis